MKRLIYTLAPFALVLLIMAASVAFNYTVIDVRIDDLDNLL